MISAGIEFSMEESETGPAAGTLAEVGPQRGAS